MTPTATSTGHHSVFILLAIVMVGALVLRVFDVSSWMDKMHRFFHGDHTAAQAAGGGAAANGTAGSPASAGAEKSEAASGAPVSDGPADGSLMDYYHPHEEGLTPQQAEWFERVFAKTEDS